MTELMQKLQFPPEAVAALSEAYKKMEGKMDHARAALFAREKIATEKSNFSGEIAELAEQEQVHPYTADMVFALYCALQLREVYREKGYPEALYWETVVDLRYKLMECYHVYGIWGSFVAYWFRDFFLCERFKLGRLQYEWQKLKYPYKELEEGTPVLNCHIPSSGPIPKEEVLDSLKRAYEFYGFNGLMPVVCQSWMLYPPHYEFFPEGGNLRDFQDAFTILNAKEDPKKLSLWRITNRMDDVVPTHTRLLRRLKAYLDAGKGMGSGYGILLFDGEKIIR